MLPTGLIGEPGGDGRQDQVEPVEHSDVVEPGDNVVLDRIAAMSEMAAARNLRQMTAARPAN